MNTPPAVLHPELLAPFDLQAITRDGHRLDHAEGASKPLQSRPEPQPRGAKVHGNRPVDQAEAAARFIAAPEHEKMHDERLWDLRQKRDRQMHGIAEWEELRSLASAIKEHTLTHLDQYLEQFEANALSNGVHVHWARDAAEHNHLVHGMLTDHGAKSGDRCQQIFDGSWLCVRAAARQPLLDQHKEPLNDTLYPALDWGRQQLLF